MRSRSQKHGSYPPVRFVQASVPRAPAFLITHTMNLSCLCIETIKELLLAVVGFPCVREDSSLIKLEAPVGNCEERLATGLG